jgi:hypothetical protein
LTAANATQNKSFRLHTLPHEQSPDRKLDADPTGNEPSPAAPEPKFVTKKNESEEASAECNLRHDRKRSQRLRHHRTAALLTDFRTIG